MTKYFTLITLENPNDHFPEFLSLVDHGNLRKAEIAFDHLVMSYDLERSEDILHGSVIARAIGYLATTNGEPIKCTVELVKK